MKRYEGLFILNTAGREEGVKEVSDQISSAINETGGKLETVQKMDKRSFARVADKKVSSGFYVNFIFECEPSALQALKHRLEGQEEVFRFMIVKSPKSTGQTEAAAV